MYKSSASMFAYFLGKAEAYRLAAQCETREFTRKAIRQMMRENALSAVRQLKQVGGAA
jgi:hypothetical protein